jgi:hypothetical protein
MESNEIDRLLQDAKQYKQLSAGNVRVSVLSFPGEHGTHLIFSHAAGRLKEMYLKHVSLLRQRGFKVCFALSLFYITFTNLTRIRAPLRCATQEGMVIRRLARK